MNWITSPEVNAQVAEWFGEAPAQTQGVRSRPRTRHFCDTYHALDAAYAGEDPLLDDAADAVRRRQRQDDCTDYSQWVDKWQQIKG